MRRKKNNFSRREFLTAAGGATAFFSLAGSVNAQATKNEKAKELLVYVGTYTSGKNESDGIYILKFNAENGAPSSFRAVKNVVDPSFLAIDKDKKYLYAVNETVEYEGKKSGAVSAFAIDQKTGGLNFLNKQPSLGGAPCHISVSDNGKFALVANYLGGNVSVLPIEKNGSLGAAVDLKQHVGSG